jgi:hypothetical protein
MVDRRAWWGAGVLIAGIGAAALAGSATAYADDGHDAGKTASSLKASHGPQSSAPKISGTVNVAQHSVAAQRRTVTLTIPRAGAGGNPVANAATSRHLVLRIPRRADYRRRPLPHELTRKNHNSSRCQVETATSRRGPGPLGVAV